MTSGGRSTKSCGGKEKCAPHPTKSCSNRETESCPNCGGKTEKSCSNCGTKSTKDGK